MRILTDRGKIDITTLTKEDTLIIADWFCGCYVGPPKWHGTKVYEPDDCYTIFSTIENLSDFEDEACVAVCPSCKADLAQADDHMVCAHFYVLVGKDLIEG